MTLACEDANSKQVDVVAVADDGAENSVDNRLQPRFRNWCKVKESRFRFELFEAQFLFRL